MKKIHLTKVILFLLALFSLSILTILNSAGKDNNFISFELRNKEKFTYPSKDKILTGEYWPQFEKFYNDRFYARGPFLDFKTAIDLKVAGKYTVSDVMLSSDRNKVFRKRDQDYSADLDNMKKGLESWKTINEELNKLGTKLLVVGIADQSHMFTDQYPTFANNGQKEYELLRTNFYRGLDKFNIDYIDTDDILRDDRENNYFYTDHHQNFDASLKIYDQIIENINIKYFPIENLREKMQIVNHDNYVVGSNGRKVFKWIKEPITLKSSEPKAPIEFTRYEDGKEVNPYINTKNYSYYTSYMGGDKAHTIIDTNRQDKPNILIVGDSTSNPLESILWQNANKMTSLDFRKFDKLDIVSYVKNNPQDIVIVSIISGNYDQLETVMK